MAFADRRETSSIRHDRAKRWQDGCEDSGQKSYRGDSLKFPTGARRGRKGPQRCLPIKARESSTRPGGREMERGHGPASSCRADDRANKRLGAVAKRGAKPTACCHAMNCCNVTDRAVTSQLCYLRVFSFLQLPCPHPRQGYGGLREQMRRRAGASK